MTSGAARTEKIKKKVRSGIECVRAISFRYAVDIAWSANGIPVTWRNGMFVIEDSILSAATGLFDVH